MIKSFVTGSISIVNGPVAIKNFLGDNEGVDEFVVAPARRGGV
jgi:hypothetical protein